MADKRKKNLYVRVRDGAGHFFLCPIDALKDPKDATDEELENCVDDAVVERFGGKIKIVDE
jgi:hypothetical protein